MRARTLWAGFVVAVLIAACTTTTGVVRTVAAIVSEPPAVVAPRESARRGEATSSVTIVNDSGEYLSGVYFRAAGATAWGTNHLSASGGGIASGRTGEVMVPIGTGTVRFAFLGGDQLFYVDVDGSFAAGATYDVDLKPNYLVGGQRLPYNYLTSYGYLSGPYWYLD
ncbi:MAG: hypothetical protein EA382_16705 [Spirochaetaceae bacterium]|nr:MAG: hypothetical protein EA382_16705 [Spirochaetaceae bacterium]